MCNWVKTRCCIIPQRNNEQSWNDFLSIRDYLENHSEDMNPLKTWGLVEGSDRITMDTYNAGQVEIDREKKHVTFSIASPWRCPFNILEKLVSKYKVMMLFSWSDETENLHIIPYGEKDSQWWLQTGSCGIGFCMAVGNEIGYYYDYPRNELEFHEFFLESWNNSKPWDGGCYFPFFDQNGMESKHPDFKIEKDFAAWIGKKMKSRQGVQFDA